MKACLLSRCILTAQITASVKVFCLHGKREDHCEEVLIVAHTLSCFVEEMGDLHATLTAFEL